jgi:putative DNA primase/helicase
MSGNRDRIADFKRTPGAGGAPPPPANDADPYLALVWPVPEAAPPRLEAHREAGRPATWWAYRDQSGQLLHWVARFNLDGGRKDVRPLTLWREPGGKLRWDWKGPPEPRPLYGLDRLAQAGSTALVLLVEGEKAADAAAALFPDSAVMTWQGGTNAAGKADWRPLAGRRVVIWPDNGEPGQKAARAVLDRLRAVGAVARIVAPPWDLFPEAWDLADPFPEGFDLAAAHAVAAEALAALAAPVSPEAHEGPTWPPGYEMLPDGLFKVHHREGDGPRPERISDPLEVLAHVQEEPGRGWGLRLRLGGEFAAGREVTVWRSQLVGSGQEVRSQLAALGIWLKPSGGRPDSFIAALNDVKGVRRRVLSVRRTGWVAPGGQFVIPGAAYGDGVIFDGPSNLKFAQRGDLVGWKEGVAAPAVDNPLLAFCLALALVGPLMRLLEWRGSGFHLRGPSAAGKTTLAEAAGSVWGGGGEHGFAQQWKTTDNALEGLAEGHNDTFLILDEIGEMDADKLGSAVYALGNGQGKARALAAGGNRDRAEWRVAFLSTGEKSLTEQIASGRAGGEARAGQQLRFLDLEADGGSGVGVWSKLGGIPAKEMSEQVVAAARTHFGHAGPALVAALQYGPRDELTSVVREVHRRFVHLVVRPGDTGQIGRGAGHFARVAAAGELAISLGLFPWPPGEAFKAARWVFERWADGFGREHTAEERQVFQRLRREMQLHATRFAGVDEQTLEEKRQADLVQWGWRHPTSTCGDCFIINTSAWAEIFKGVASAQTAAKALQKVGFLVPDGSPEGQAKSRLQRTYRKQRAYWVRAAFLESDLGG